MLVFIFLVNLLIGNESGPVYYMVVFALVEFGIVATIIAILLLFSKVHKRFPFCFKKQHTSASGDTSHANSISMVTVE